MRIQARLSLLRSPDEGRVKVLVDKPRTVDTTVVHQVTWPHEVIYSLSAQPAIYDQLYSIAFVDEYLTVMSR